MTTKTPNEICDLIYHRHQSAMQLVHDTHATLHGSIVAFSLRLALTELAAALQDSQPPADTPDRMIEQIYRINDWLQNDADGADLRHFDADGDTASAVIAYADRLRDTAERLRTELAAAIDKRNVAEAAYVGMEAEVAELHQHLAQLDADNARLIKELAILRSFSVTTPTGSNGKSDVVNPQSTTPWDDDTMLTGLDAATLDYWHGINAGRWTWRKLPKSVRLAMVRHVLSFTETDAAMSMSQFDAFKPHWMPGAGTHPITFGVTWSTLADLRTEIEVPA